MDDKKNTNARHNKVIYAHSSWPVTFAQFMHFRYSNEYVMYTAYSTLHRHHHFICFSALWNSPPPLPPAPSNSAFSHPPTLSQLTQVAGWAGSPTHFHAHSPRVSLYDSRMHAHSLTHLQARLLTYSRLPVGSSPRAHLQVMGMLRFMSKT